MSIVTEISWDDMLDGKPLPETAARHAWREAVAQIAERAKQTLPECHGRVDSAVKIVLAGDVEPLEDGTTRVASQSNGQVVYHVVNGECTCKDYTKAASGWCKHRIAAGLYTRATALVQRKLAQHANGASNGARNGATSQPEPPVQPDTSTAPLPEAPVSITLKAALHGHEVLVTLRGVDFASVKTQVEQASAWLQSQTPAQASRAGEGWCRLHAVQMQHNQKAGRSWWSHKTADGWCKGR